MGNPLHLCKAVVCSGSTEAPGSDLPGFKGRSTAGVELTAGEHNIPISQSLFLFGAYVTRSCYFSLSLKPPVCVNGVQCAGKWWEMMLHIRIWYQRDSIYWNSIISNFKYINLSPALITKILSASVEVFISNSSVKSIESNKNKKYILIIHLNANTWLFDLGCKCWNIFNIKLIDHTINSSSLKICTYTSVSKLFQS